MTDEEKTLATQLMLLFDGKGDKEIAESIVSALGMARAERLAYVLNYHAGINICIALSPMDIRGEVEDRNSDWADSEGKYELACTPEELAYACRNHSWGDTGELYSLERDDLFDQCEKDGLIKHTPKDDEK